VKRKIILLAAVAALLLTAFDARLAVTHYQIQSAKISSPVKLALITDLHSCYYGKGQQTLVSAIDAAEPDALLFSGDICDDLKSNNNTEILLDAVAGRYPCYYVTGNHEIWSREAAAVKEMFRGYDVHVLSGESEALTVREQTLLICGVDDPDRARYEKGAPTFGEQLAAVAAEADGAGDGVFSVLMSHRPERVSDYSRYGFDLIVSGHAHGGQWRLPWGGASLYAPDQGLNPRYTSGVYDLENSGAKMVVSRGLARESTRVPRVFNRPELVVITLT
jgi:predicted MPP superfamily phosphohydrolase